jgi:hypothetical protein
METGTVRAPKPGINGMSTAPAGFVTMAGSRNAIRWWAKSISTATALNKSSDSVNGWKTGLERFAPILTGNALISRKVRSPSCTCTLTVPFAPALGSDETPMDAAKSLSMYDVSVPSMSCTRTSWPLTLAGTRIFLPSWKLKSIQPVVGTPFANDAL